jgi:hypothetical protein
MWLDGLPMFFITLVHLLRDSEQNSAIVLDQPECLMRCGNFSSCQIVTDAFSKTIIGKSFTVLHLDRGGSDYSPTWSEV